MRVEVEIGTVEIDALPPGVTAEGLRAAVVGALKARMGSTTIDPLDLRASSDVTAPISAGQTHQDHLANAIARAVTGDITK
ncbi:MAG: hypothetical protein MI785_25850 [Kiloniellales bacterium]|nr:hypothetical protein [Kiloniellales bacterium]